ncbi:SDR family NAD(P)-dependent oxidoreductase [Planctomicrobium sp. SH661]|uniref:SDR family NAD(P)-dependent oxidoreductase n=1 Tax=Planctomicrobium sp. SH661 TaxID=3448124 RepID=UPI003F5BBBD6
MDADGLVLEPIAVVGMDCCLPGAAHLNEFEELLFSGRSGVSELPPHRIDCDLYFDARRGQPGKTYTTLGGTVPDRPVDLQAAGIPAETAKLIDPVHLRFCEVAVRAWRNAGFQAHDPAWSRAGVFVGHSGATLNGGGLNLATQIEEGLDFLNDVPEFQAVPQSARDSILRRVAEEIRKSRPQRTPDHVPNYQAYTAAALPAHVLGLSGPRIVCDAACASSLFAMQQAITAIRLGRIDAAIVGGATTNGVDNLILFSQSQACSDRGSSPFDHSASGLISSEGYAAVVIVPQRTALKLQLPILGVIAGLGTASDGRGKSLWAPRAEGQQLAIRRAYPENQPLTIDYLEAHATSTQLGDATELQAVDALRRASSSRESGAPLLIGSLKSNLGHTLETAGVAGLIKILLSMKRGEIPASLNYRTPNERFEWSAGTIEVVSQRRPWNPRGPVRRSAVSAFGIGGLNAHLFVQHAPDPAANGMSVKASVVRNQTHSREPIAIVGRGVVLPGSHHLQQFKTLLNSGRSMIGAPPVNRWRSGIGVQPGAERGSFRTPTAQGGFIRDYNFDGQPYRIPPKQVKQANPLQMMLLDAVTQAVQEMDRGAWKFDRQKTGVVIGTIFSGDFGSQLQLGLRLPEISRKLREQFERHGVPPERIEAILAEYRKLVLESRPALLDETGSFTASTLASRIAKTFDLMGGACAIDVDDASGLAAVHHAVDQLRLGTWDVAVCGAAERAMDLSKFEQLDLTGKLLRSGRINDIPEDCRQILPGEGAVVMLLERLSTAEAAGHPILGIIDDVENFPSNTTSTFGFRSSHRNHNTREDNSGVTPEAWDRDRDLVRQIGYLTGAHSLAQLLKATVQWESAPVGEAAAETSKTILSQTEDGIVYRMKCRPRWSAERKSSPRMETTSFPLTSLQTTAVHMGDQSGTFNVTRPTEPATFNAAPAGSTALKLFRFQAPSQESLLSAIQVAEESAQATFLTPLEAFHPDCASRLAVLAESPAQLKERLSAIRKNWSKGRTAGVFETERAILWQARPNANRVAWVYPGQGSQYAGSPAAIAASPSAAGKLKDLDHELVSSGLEPLTPRLQAGTQPPLTDIWWNQLWVLGISLALTEELKGLGLRPDLVLGHSFGEYSALVAGGCLTPAQALRMVKSRADAVAMTVREPGQLISVRGTPNTVESAIRSADLPATITHFNAPQQTVIATACSQVDAVRKALSSVNLASLAVPVPVAYHTDRLRSAEDVLRRTFSHERFLPPTSGFLSTTSVRYLSEPDDLRQMLISHLTLPVLYVPAIERLIADGFNLFLEVGPNQILSRLNTEIAGSRAICLSLDVPGRSHEERLLLVQAALEMTSTHHRAWSEQGVTVSTSAVRSPVASAPPVIAAAAQDDVEIVDLRKSRRKEKETTTASPSLNGHHHDSSSSAVELSNGHLPNSPAPVVKSQPVADRQGPSLDDVKKFLLTVVVDLTGYSPDVIDFDADLEADLGVDSIKKAQVVGELAECFELSVAPSGVTMSDLRTLGDIAAIGVQYGTSGKTSAAPAAPPEATPSPTVVATSTSKQPEAGLDLASIERFLIDLVVDQTGYSPEVVDLDADMEGELGIDSIKQAQLLGEVQQQFELPVVAAEGRSLTSFSTLRSILNFLAETLPVNGTAAFRMAVPEEAPTQTPPSDFSFPLKKNDPDSLHSGSNGSAGIQTESPLNNGVFSAVSEEVIGLELSDEISPEAKQLFTVEAAESNGDSWTRGIERGKASAREIRGTLRLLIDLQESSTATIDLPEPVTLELQGLAAGAGVSFPSVLHAHSIFARQRCEASPTVAKCAPEPLPTPGRHTGNSEHHLPLKSEQSMRFGMRISRAPQRPGMPTTPQFSGPALIVGDNEISQAIRHRFESHGRACHIVPKVDSIESLNAWLGDLWIRELTPHLFITTSHDADALRGIDSQAWKSRRFSAVEVPYRVCQLWMQRMIDAGKMDGASVVAVLNLGGDFGFSGKTCISPEGGLGGLIKAMLIEAWMRGFRATPMKVIDVAPVTPAAVAVEGIWRELAIPSYDMEVALHGNERYAVQPVFQPLETRPDELRNGNSKVRPGGTWVVTGGARGITSVVVRELAKRHGLKLHLLGTAPAPAVTAELRIAAEKDRLQVRRAVMAAAAERNENGMEAWRNVEKGLEIDATLRLCQSEGITASYHCCDVSDLDRLQSTLQRIREQDGPIVGVIHGAGIGQDARFDRKRPDKVDQCLRAKIDGCINLMDATRQDPLDSFVAFGSISGRFGANGHTDYSFANDSLAKLVGRYRRERPEVASVTFHWHAWGDIGMATKPETKLALEMINLEFMPAREGIAHFLNELEAGGDEPEVLITDRAYYRKFFPIDRNVLPAEHDAVPPTSYPLLDPEGDLPTPRDGQFAIELNPEKERFLNQHLVQGKPTLPFVVALEMMAEAARTVTNQPLVLEARDIEALQAIKWSTPSPMTIHVRAEAAGGEVQCALIADVRRRDGRIVAKDRTYFQGMLVPGNSSPKSTAIRPDLSHVQWAPIQYLEPTAPIYHGPDMQCLQSIAIDGNQAFGQISASSTVQLGGGHRPTFGWSVHCAAMDACLYAAALFAGKRFGRASLPVKFDRIRFGRLPDPGEPCLVAIQLIQESAEGVELAFQLIGLNEELLLDVEGYHIGWLS